VSGLASRSSRRILVGAIVAFCLPVAVAGCSAANSFGDPTPSASAWATEAEPSPLDPLLALEDPSSPDFIEPNVRPALSARDFGPKTYQILPGGARAADVYVSCSPQAEFTVRVFSNFFSGTCAPRFGQHASIPIPPGPKASELTLEIAAGIDHYVVVILDAG
jgi:hypothetical protein